ncbi:MAG: class I SAM-dependent methyltransferase, partial [bacterium]|nr:class I SAM-dependent methyltransferase [bacterium]
MKHIVGAWSWWETFLYDLLITPRLRPLYDLFADHADTCYTDGPILEVGCGSAVAATIMAARHPDASVTATDL